MSTTAVERLMRDLKRLQQDATPADDDIMLWNAIIVGLMLGDPNPYSPANQQAATMLIERRIDYYKKAQRIVELSCKAV